MAVLQRLFNKSVNQYSPAFKEDKVFTIKRTKDGEAQVVFLPEDVKRIQQENGTVDMWSLDTLLAAGINPATMHVHTGFNTRLEGVDTVNEYASIVEAALLEDENNDKNED